MKEVDLVELLKARVKQSTNLSDCQNFKVLNKVKLSLFGNDFNVNQIIYRGHSSYKIPWIINNEVDFCMRCELHFGYLAWRHHCRNCGYLVCNTCSNQMLSIPALNENGGSRVCKLCYIQSSIQKTDMATSPMPQFSQENHSIPPPIIQSQPQNENLKSSQSNSSDEIKIESQPERTSPVQSQPPTQPLSPIAPIDDNSIILTENDDLLQTPERMSIDLRSISQEDEVRLLAILGREDYEETPEFRALSVMDKSKLTKLIFQRNKRLLEIEKQNRLKAFLAVEDSPAGNLSVSDRKEQVFSQTDKDRQTLDQMKRERLEEFHRSKKHAAIIDMDDQTPIKTPFQTPSKSNLDVSFVDQDNFVPITDFSNIEPESYSPEPILSMSPITAQRVSEALALQGGVWDNDEDNMSGAGTSSVISESPLHTPQHYD